VKLAWYRETLREESGGELSLSAVSRAGKRVAPAYTCRGRGRPKASGESAPATNPVGGFELIIAVAYHLGWPQQTADVMAGAVRRVKRTKRYKASPASVDSRGRRTGAPLRSDLINGKKEGGPALRR